MARKTDLIAINPVYGGLVSAVYGGLVSAGAAMKRGPSSLKKLTRYTVAVEKVFGVDFSRYADH
jgi:hypothetical protein